MFKTNSKRNEVKLAYIFNSISYKQLAVFHADPPDYSSPKPEMRLRGPKVIDLGIERPQGKNSADPIYDAQNSQIVYTLNRNDPDLISVCYISKHFEVVAIDKTSCRLSTKDPNSSVSFVGGLTSITTLERTSPLGGPMFSLKIRQKKKGSEWKEGPNIGDFLPQIDQGHRMISPPSEEAIEYVYHLAIQEVQGAGYLEYFIYTIPSTRFVELHENPSLKWSKSRLRTTMRSKGVEQAPAYVFTKNKAASQGGPEADYRRNLLLFSIDNDQNCIDTATVKLRDDGSVIVDSDGTVRTNPGKIVFLGSHYGYNKRDLCAFVYTNDFSDGDPGLIETYVLLTWNGGALVGTSMAGLINKVSDTGTVEDNTGWQQVSVSFDNNNHSTSNLSQMKGVMVASNFV